MMTEQEHNNVQWRKVKLGDCCSINPKTDISKVQNDDIVSFVKMEDVSNDGFITSFSERPYKSLQKKGFTIFQNDDVIFAKITPCMENGKGALVRNMKSKICLGSTEFHVLRACANVSIDFIYQLTISKRFRQRAEMQMTGSAGQQRVPTAFLEDCLISIPFKNNKPDLSAQRRIAAILTSADKVIAATQKTIAKYKQIKQGMMEELFNEQCTMNNVQWRKVRLGEVGEIVTGSTPSTTKAEYWDGEYNFYSPADFDDSVYCGKTERTVTKAGMDTGRRIPENSIMVACIASIGKLSINRTEGITNQQINTIVPKTGYDYIFLYYLLLFNVEKIKGGAAQTTIPIINKEDFSNLEFSVPNLSEQRRIAAILSGLDAKIAAEEKVLEKYEKVKKGLMEKLLNE